MGRKSSSLFTDYETIIPEEVVEKIDAEPEVIEKVEEAIDKATKRGKKKKEDKVEIEEVASNLVTVEIKNLNVRKGPGKEFGKEKDFLKPGTYEIEKEENGYGRIKNTNHWIALKFTRKV